MAEEPVVWSENCDPLSWDNDKDTMKLWRSLNASAKLIWGNKVYISLTYCSSAEKQFTINCFACDYPGYGFIKPAGHFVRPYSVSGSSEFTVLLNACEALQNVVDRLQKTEKSNDLS